MRRRTAEVNQLFHNAMWGQFDNFLDIPTDCPQRDERLGWTGDAAIISATACKNLYMPAFFHHFLHNVGQEQRYCKGAVPFFVPAPKAPDEAGAFWLSGSPDGCAIWSDVATMMPWAVYENYGDLSLLREEYPVMKAWVERIRQDDQADGGRGLWLRGRQLGDWLALDREDGDTQNPFGATSLPYTATAFYYYSASLTAKAAKALGYGEDQQEYQGLCETIKAAFLEEYFQADGTFENPRHPDGLRAVPVLRAVPRWQTGRGAGGFGRSASGPGATTWTPASAARPSCAGPFRTTAPTTWPTPCSLTRTSPAGCTR